MRRQTNYTEMVDEWTQSYELGLLFGEEMDSSPLHSADDEEVTSGSRVGDGEGAMGRALPGGEANQQLARQTSHGQERPPSRLQDQDLTSKHSGDGRTDFGTSHHHAQPCAASSECAPHAARLLPQQTTAGGAAGARANARQSRPTATAPRTPNTPSSLASKMETPSCS